ncbi:hypothetical protein E1B28_000178 [Marasmius oreades]|uniref:Uncharacterized protein n=1 Tax=Marasmius oreades TaxID=181124 RepID=A0A9P7V0Z1_9AGAR|nr:uncharacterized protein E1B28_000178 [Marasmius oreades]KAG7098210.1 hypothetical protein E1B28_000178 [Marasmius oreades]
MRVFEATSHDHQEFELELRGSFKLPFLVCLTCRVHREYQRSFNNTFSEGRSCEDEVAMDYLLASL